MNKYILHVLSIKLRDKLYFSFSIPAPGFPHFYYMSGANLELLLYGEVSVMGWLINVLNREFTSEKIKLFSVLFFSANFTSLNILPGLQV